ncbi:phosphoenolpyruvate carboxylase [Hyphococcus sp. DH-69]|uniref:phosphoenolpyruvate carboxylase n=1 Tax=Hyphococcus formosus TaxID=3143534 RepID=UPI00398ACE2E
MNDQPVAKNVDRLLSDFRRFSGESDNDPHLNPVSRLASALFLGLESGEVSIGSLTAIANDLNDRSFEDRAEAFHLRRGDGACALEDILAQLAQGGFEEFKAAVEGAPEGVVFTAHPTFALSAARRDVLAAYPVNGSDSDKTDWRQKLAKVDEGDDQITLRYEHDEARKAIANAQEAVARINRAILNVAQKHFPEKWADLRLQPLSVATWVGYDLDGRTDIHWGESIRIRIDEKAKQLQRYVASLQKIQGETPSKSLQDLLSQLTASAKLAEQQAKAFAGDLDDPSTVVQAANLLTDENPARLTSLDPIVEALTKEIEESDSDARKAELLLLRAEMESYGLGLARIHLRVNSAQVRSALRADLGLDPDTGFLGRSALDVAAKKAMAAQRRAVNFGSVFLEKMTARRQFMLCAQILKHIDADTPIRFLIAECEAPATIMGAVYLARLYGVEHKLDISPLFETPQALESGGRFIERLLREPEYRDYVSGRGVMSIQLGFSDSGRFMGQCAADLAIERLQVLFARALGAADLPGIEALVFNTHGESMGRGAHPGSFSNRLDHLTTPWVRSRFAKENIRLRTECSFQGGEGYTHFQTPELAAQTMAMVWAHSRSIPEAAQEDRFYSDINYSWDVYRGLKTWQEGLFEREDYRKILSGFALRLLFKTGSRQTKRSQSGGFDLSALRAIPHNAILQQLGAPVNVSGGFGKAAGKEPDRFVEQVEGSTRMRALMAMAVHARDLTDVSVLRAYADIYAPGYWSAMAVSAGAGKAADSYEAAQMALEDSGTSQAFQHLADFVSSDLRHFDEMIGAVDLSGMRKETVNRDRLCVLHAVRQALMAKAVSLVASAPPFSRRHDVEHRNLIEMTLDLRIDETADLLGRIFPANSKGGNMFSGLDEKVEDIDAEGGAYPEIHREIIWPLREISVASRTLSEAIANHYGAFG